MSENAEHPYLSVENGKLFVHNETGLLLQEVAFYLSPEMAAGNPHESLYWEGLGFSYAWLHHGKFTKPLSKGSLPGGSKWRVEILWATPDRRSHHHVQILEIE